MQRKREGGGRNKEGRAVEREVERGRERGRHRGRGRERGREKSREREEFDKCFIFYLTSI